MDSTTIGEKISAIEQDVENLKGWQKSQNSAIYRVEAKVEKLLYWIMGQMAAIIILAISIFLSGK